MGELSGFVFDFEWDDEKAAENLRKHRVDFEEAASVFDDELMVTEADWVHSEEEDRYVSLGLSNKNRLLVVIYTERVRTIRLISAREPTAREKYSYEHSNS